MIVRAWLSDRLPGLPRQNEGVEKAAARRDGAKKVAEAAKHLSKVLEDAGAEVHAAIIKALNDEAAIGLRAVEPSFHTQREFLRDLAAAAEKASRGRRGRPRDWVARQAILDLAEIFQYATRTDATRSVDRERHAEQGRFYDFCAAVWPIAFGGGDDHLDAALRNYQDHKKQSKRWIDVNETFLEGLDDRYPEWGIFGGN
jgi:hypothetical protein